MYKVVICTIHSFISNSSTLLHSNPWKDLLLIGVQSRDLCILIVHDFQGPPLTSIVNKFDFIHFIFVLLGGILAGKPIVDLCMWLDLDTQIVVQNLYSDGFLNWNI